MKKILCAIFAVFALSSACFAADYYGYIVRISENTAMRLSEGGSMYSDFSLLEELDDSEVVKLVAEEFENIEEINSEHMLVKAVDEESLNELIALGIVESFEEDAFMELLGYDVTKNPYYEDQKWYLDSINADFAWDAGIFGNNVKVAVIDSGIFAHSDIKKNLLPGKNFFEVESFGESYVNDNSDHGTRVAGIIAAECNSLSSVGISFKTKILPLKVTDGNELPISSAVSAIYYATDQGCDVINLSFGSDKNSTELQNAINYAISKNVIVVAAAGNFGDTGYIYPAAYDEVISVANVEQRNGSLYVKDSSQKNDMVDIAAPGTGVYTLTNSDTVSDSKSGTSFSCPIVSALAALAKSVNPDLSQSEFEALLKASADSSYLAASGQDSTAWGAGLADTKKLLQYLLSNEKCYVSEAVTVNEESFAYVTNLSDTEKIENCTVIISEYDSNNNLNVEYLKCTLDPGVSLEISLTENGFSSSASVRVICDRVPGDVNGDGIVNVRDASVILRHLAGYNVVADISMMDVNGDEFVSVRDASAILRFCAGYSVQLH